MNENNSDQQVWFMEENEKSVAAAQNINMELQIQRKSEALTTDIPSSSAIESKGCDKGGYG